MVLPGFDSVLTDRPRIALAADIAVGDRVVRVINVHLDTVLNVTDRILQLRPAIIDAPAVVLVGGDFNTGAYLWADGALPIAPAHSVADTSQGPILDDYLRHLGFATPTAGLGDTVRAVGTSFRLDAIYTRGLAPHPGGVVKRIERSDHWPLWIDVELP
jgi:endonuclease/exonuclease/phosphatase family metal-dependent hydrolase